MGQRPSNKRCLETVLALRYKTKNKTVKYYLETVLRPMHVSAFDSYHYWPMCLRVSIRHWLKLGFDFNSTALRPFDDLRYDRRPTCVRAGTLRPN